MTDMVCKNSGGALTVQGDPAPGTVMDDGTVYAGVSPETGQGLYVLPQDAPSDFYGLHSWGQARAHVVGLEAHGHDDWDIPTKAELDVLFRARDKGALKNTFNRAVCFSGRNWYWSATNAPDYPEIAWVQDFEFGFKTYSHKSEQAFLRPVRRSYVLGAEVVEGEPVAMPTFEGQAIAYIKPPSKGIYLGRWTPEDRHGRDLGKTFELFAAPEDLKTLFLKRQLLASFDKAVKTVAAIHNLHGHPGFDHRDWEKKPDEVLLDALRSGNYRGEWFIPTRDILEDHLLPNWNQGLLAGTFVTEHNDVDLSHWYWSCTTSRAHINSVWNQQFSSDPAGGWENKSAFRQSTRLVRAEPKWGLYGR